MNPLAEDPRPLLTGVVLAGGLARRMGGQDKGLIELAGRPLVAYVLEALAPQVQTLLVNANRNLDRYSAFGHPVIPDLGQEFAGPLAGMASALQRLETPYLLTAPCDSPLLPSDLAARLFQRLRQEGAQVCAAHDGARIQPVFALMERGLLPDLLAYLAAGERKIDRWFERQRLALADFSDRPETFANINTPEELEALEARLRES